MKPAQVFEITMRGKNSAKFGRNVWNLIVAKLQDEDALKYSMKKIVKQAKNC